jgi:hypothetical protein
MVNANPATPPSPRHFWADEQVQYRVKLRRFSKLPAEFTVQRISFEQEYERYRKAWSEGRPSVGRPARSKPAAGEPRSSESLERSQRRAKTGVRLLVTELAPSALVTFTTRETLSLDQLLWVWQHFTRSMRLAGQEFEYVAVPEPHPTNPDHLHLHVAYRGRTPFGMMRRFWHIALEALHGRRVTCILRGKEAPGNIDVQPVKSRDSIRRIRKIARYVSKYITKDLISEFNRRRYWPSKGIDLREAQVFWLDSLSMSDAIREACRMLGQWDEEAGVPAQRLFNPSDRVAWCAIDPEAVPPPPF